MLDKEKGVMGNESHTETDDYITRTYVMPLLFDDESRRRLIAEHRNSPVGNAPSNGRSAIEHSHDLRKILDKMRRAPMAGKYVTICVFECLSSIRLESFQVFAVFQWTFRKKFTHQKKHVNMQFF